jgi:hypothetical protein
VTFGYCSVYAPLSVRLVQQLEKPGWRNIRVCIRAFTKKLCIYYENCHANAVCYTVVLIRVFVWNKGKYGKEDQALCFRGNRLHFPPHCWLT